MNSVSYDGLDIEMVDFFKSTPQTVPVSGTMLFIVHPDKNVPRGFLGALSNTIFAE